MPQIRYALISTGKNLETVLSWKNQVNGKRWYENFDVELGINSESASRDQSVVLVGTKNRGQKKTKPISTPIKVNSPLFNYLKYS